MSILHKFKIADNKKGFKSEKDLWITEVND